jgi:hypothetical protein
MKFYWLVLGVLAVWRATFFLQAEDGPWEVVVRLRVAVGNGFWGKLLDCFYCLSVWIAAPFALWLGENWRERFLLWLSFSAGASLLQKLTAPKVPPAPYVAEPAEQELYGMLWSKKGDGGQTRPANAAGDSGKPDGGGPNNALGSASGSDSARGGVRADQEAP